MRLVGNTISGDNRHNKLSKYAVTLVSLLGLAACSADIKGDVAVNPKNEVARIYEQLEGANNTLRADWQEYSDYTSSLSESCQAATEPYLAEGELYEVSDEMAVVQTLKWCGPDNIDAVLKIRNMYDEQLNLHSLIDQLSVSLEANLAAAGVTPETKLG